MSIAAKIKTEQVVEDISQELNSAPKDDLKDLKKEASAVKKEGKGSHRGSRPFKCCSEKVKMTADVNNTTKDEYLKAIDDLEKSMEPKIEPPSEEDIIGAIENDVKSKHQKNEDVLKAIEQLQQSEIKPEITKKFYCQNEMDRHVITKHDGHYSCTFCDFNTMSKENISLHMKTIAKVASITKYAANVKKAASITKTTASAKNATKSTAKVATVTKSANKDGTITKSTTNVASKVDHSKKTSKLAAKDEVSEIVSITPVTKTLKSQNQTPVKKNILSKNKQNSPTTSVVKKIIKIESNKQSDLKNNFFRSDSSADKANNLNLFEYVGPKEETMLNFLTKVPIAKFTPAESSPFPPSLGSLSVMHVFGKQTIHPIEEKEHKKPQEVDQNPQEDLATEVPSKFVDEDDEEDFECKDCVTIFWTNFSEMYIHLRDTHGVEEPEPVEQKKKQNQIAFHAKKVEESKLEQPKENGLKTATPNLEKNTAKATEAHSCAPCNFKSECKQKLYQHIQTERHAQTIKDKDKKSNLPNKRKAEDEAANQNKAKSNAPKIGHKQCSKNVKVAITPVQNLKEKASTTKSQNHNKVPQNSYSKVAIPKAKKPNSKVSKSLSKNLNNKATHGYSGVIIAPVVSKLSNTASKQHSVPVVTKLPNNKTKQQPSTPVVTKLSNKTTKQQTPVPVVTKMINKTAPIQPLAEVVAKLPNNKQIRPPVPVVTKLPSKTTNQQQSSKKQTPQKKLDVQRLSAKIQKLRNKLKSKAAEGGTNTESIKITPLPKNGSPKQQTPVPVVTKMINKTAPIQPLAEVVAKLPNNKQKRPPVPVVTKLASKTTNQQQSSKKQTPQKKLDVQRLGAKIQKLQNKLKSKASEGGTNSESIKITPLPKHGSLPSSKEKPENKVANNDDTADYSCKLILKTILKRKEKFSQNDSPTKKIPMSRRMNYIVMVDQLSKEDGKSALKSRNLMERRSW